MTRVFPDPAPASTSCGPSPWVTAAICSGFRQPSRSRARGMTGGSLADGGRVGKRAGRRGPAPLPNWPGDARASILATIDMATSIHIPKTLLDAVDRKARALKMSRNRLIVRALERELTSGADWSPEFFERLK